MKKALFVALIVIILISLSACTKPATPAEPSNNHTNNNQQTTISTDNASQPSSKNETEPSRTTEVSTTNSHEDEEVLEPFNRNATIEETVMYDEDGVKITAKQLRYTNYSVELVVTIENETEKDLSFICGSVGYSCNSVNGYMVSDGYMNCDVSAGKKANDSIGFKYNGLLLFGINEISDIEIGFDISDDDYNHTYTGPQQVKTSLYSSHDYSKDYYQDTITSRAAMNTFDYVIRAYSDDTLYDENGVRVVSSCLMEKDRDGSEILVLELENNTDNYVHLSASEIALNGLVVYTSAWASESINPNKYGFIEINFSSVFDPGYWSIYGIQEVGSISLSLKQSDAEYNTISDGVTIEVNVPEILHGYDRSGNEVYNKNGLRIISKSIVVDSSDYRNNLHVLLLAENNSDRTLTIDDKYNSLSVNGYMTDYYFSSKKIGPGQTIAFEIELKESSLSDNQISSVSDISEIEFCLEIEENYKKIDTPTIVLNY